MILLNRYINYILKIVIKNIIIKIDKYNKDLNFNALLIIYLQYIYAIVIVLIILILRISSNIVLFIIKFIIDVKLNNLSEIKINTATVLSSLFLIYFVKHWFLGISMRYLIIIMLLTLFFFRYFTIKVNTTTIKMPFLLYMLNRILNYITDFCNLIADKAKKLYEYVEHNYDKTEKNDSKVYKTKKMK